MAIRGDGDTGGRGGNTPGMALPGEERPLGRHYLGLGVPGVWVPPQRRCRGAGDAPRSRFFPRSGDSPAATAWARAAPAQGVSPGSPYPLNTPMPRAPSAPEPPQPCPTPGMPTAPHGHTPERRRGRRLPSPGSLGCTSGCSPHSPGSRLPLTVQGGRLSGLRAARSGPAVNGAAVPQSYVTGGAAPGRTGPPSRLRPSRRRTYPSRRQFRPLVGTRGRQSRGWGPRCAAPLHPPAAGGDPSVCPRQARDPADSPPAWVGTPMPPRHPTVPPPGAAGDPPCATDPAASFLPMGRDSPCHPLATAVDPTVPPYCHHQLQTGTFPSPPLRQAPHCATPRLGTPLCHPLLLYQGPQLCQLCCGGPSPSSTQPWIQWGSAQDMVEAPSGTQSLPKKSLSTHAGTTAVSPLTPRGWLPGPGSAESPP